MSVIARRKFLIDGQACDGIMGTFVSNSNSVTVSELIGYDKVSFFMSSASRNYAARSGGNVTVIAYDGNSNKAAVLSSSQTFQAQTQSETITLDSTTGTISVGSGAHVTLYLSSDSSMSSPVDTTYTYFAWKS